MESYNPRDLRIHDQELAHELAHQTDGLISHHMQILPDYFKTLFQVSMEEREKGEVSPKLSKKAEGLRSHLISNKLTIAEIEQEVMIAELNRRYHEQQ